MTTPLRARLIGLLTFVLVQGLNAGCAPVSPLPGSAAAIGQRIPSSVPAIDNGAVGTPPSSGKTLFAIYMVGSDLEDDLKPRDGVPDEVATGALSKVGAGSNDLREIVTGYQALSASEQANVDVLVAFGGSRKQGWKGIKYADMPILSRDAADGYFGNEPQYLSADASADMGAGTTFQAFLQRVQARSPGAGKVVVEVWDHGRSYLGIGPDTNSGNHLSPPAMRAALMATGFHGDIIAFDACLMASVEVAGAMAGPFHYLVGSEEDEPGHGWDYRPIVAYLGQHPTATAMDLGKTMVDWYIESAQHVSSKGRTLSLVDLSQIDAVTTALDDWSTAADGQMATTYQAVLSAAESAQQYGISVLNGVISVDLADLTARYAAAVPSGAAQATAVGDAIKKAVIYARQSGDKPNSNGLSIYALGNPRLITQGKYTVRNAASSQWYTYAGHFTAHGEADSQPPTVTPVNGAGSPTSGPDRYQVGDDVGIAHVFLDHVRPLPNAPGQFDLIVREPLIPDTGSQNRYTLPAWDGTSLHLVSSGKVIEVPYTLEKPRDSGPIIADAAVQWNGEDADLFLEFDATGTTVSAAWIVPLEKSSDGPEGPDKDQFQLQDGDTVAFYYPVYDGSTHKESDRIGTTLTIGADYAFNWQVGRGVAAFITAADLAGNEQSSTPRWVAAR